MQTRHIGAAGELLVQYQLLKHSIDSARLTTDAGIDLVAYAPDTAEAVTIQVKARERPSPAGGSGALAVSWDFPHTSPAQLVALVDLSTDSVWLFTIEQAQQLAQQHAPNGNRKLYWYVGDRVGTALHHSDFEDYRLDAVVAELFR